MVRIQNVTNRQWNSNGKYNIVAELFADSKSDDLSSIINLGKNEVLAMGSSVLTASGDLAFLKSDGTWNWT